MYGVQRARMPRPVQLRAAHRCAARARSACKPQPPAVSAGLTLISGSSNLGISGSSILGALNKKDGRLKAGASSAASCSAAAGAAFSTGFGFASFAAGASDEGGST